MNSTNPWYLKALASRLTIQTRKRIPSQLIAVPKLFRLRQISWSRELSLAGSSSSAAAAASAAATVVVVAVVVVASTVAMGILQRDI